MRERYAVSFKTHFGAALIITALAFSRAALSAEPQPRLTAEEVMWGKGKFGGAMQLEGADAYLACGKDKTYDLAGPLTIEVWLNRVGCEPWRRIVGKGRSYFLDTGSTGDSVRFVLMNPDGVAFVNLQADQVLPQNTWAHVAATFDGKGLARILVNGKAIKSAEVAARAIRVVDAPLCVGNDGEKMISGFEGLIDEVRISKSCRQAFDVSKESVSDPDTVLLLNFNEAQELVNAVSAKAVPKPDFLVPFEIELIGDPHGERGVNLKWLSPNPGGNGAREDGTLRRQDTKASPIWTLVEAYSKASIASVEPLTLPEGQKQWTNAYKKFSLGHGTPDADFVLGVNAIEEYGNQYRSNGAPWPHLLLEQDICAPGGHLSKAGPSLADCRAMTLRVSVKLRYANNLHERGRGYSEGVHAAQFLLYFTLQNLNRKSPGYGKEYVWFGVPFYDDRYPVIPPGYMSDGTGKEDESKGEKRGTGRFINCVGTKSFAEHGLIPGREWLNIHTNVLPLMVEALERAWSRGLCNSSTNLSDYKIGSMNIGWEVPGLSSVSAQFKDLSLLATGPKAKK
jgi:hypothetical protein